MNAGRIQKKDISIHVNQKPAQDLKACLEFSSGYFLQGGYNKSFDCSHITGNGIEYMCKSKAFTMTFLAANKNYR